MSRVLTALNAEVTTASVTVKSLTLEKRQVTLAVFRQLIEEPIFDWDKMALCGVGWGHVRYMIDEPPDQAINLVWQKGNDLRRCIVHKAAPGWTERVPGFRLRHDNPILARRDGKTLNRYYQWEAVYWRNWVYAKFDEINVYAMVGDRPKPEAAAVPLNYKDPDAWQQAADEAKAKHAAAVRQWEDKCFEVVQKHYTIWRDANIAAKQRIDSWRVEYASTVLPLFDLPQLFIAV